MIGGFLSKFSFSFPKTIFVSQNLGSTQLNHIAGEFEEANTAYKDYVIGAENIDHFAEEVMDLYHSTETMLRILEERYRVNLKKLQMQIVQKNNKRNYYDSMKG